jgi:hypothetical protein
VALKAKSLFLYGYRIDETNNSLDFRAVLSGPELRATLTIGYYSLSSLMVEIKRAMQAVFSTNAFTVSANRTLSFGTQNRVTITTSGTYLDLLFLTGTRNGTNCAAIIGFNVADYTGSTSYTGFTSSGTIVIPPFQGHDYLSPDLLRRNLGSVNISTNGEKEAIVFNIMKFWQVRFKYISVAELTPWVSLMTWMSLQKLIEFTPEITSPNSFYEGTIEQSSEDGKGFGYRLAEQLNVVPDLFETGLMRFRLRE